MSLLRLVFNKHTVLWFLGVLLVSLVYHTGYQKGISRMNLEIQNVHEKYQSETKRLTLEKQQALNEISRRYQADLQQIKDEANTTINNLNDTNQRLYVKLKAVPSNSKSTSCRRVSDDRAELDKTTARDLIEITKRGDKWIKALQDSLKQCTTNNER